MTPPLSLKLVLIILFVVDDNWGYLNLMQGYLKAALPLSLNQLKTSLTINEKTFFYK